MALSSPRLIAAALTLTMAAPLAAEPTEHDKQVYHELVTLPWVDTGDASISNVASIKASEKAEVVTGDGAAKFIELSGNTPHPGATIVAPKDFRWFSIYSYQDVGYVTDKDEIDADKLMQGFKDREPADNAERTKMGLDELHVTDWAVKPHYDPATHNVEWGLKIRSSRGGGEVINYTTRHLGRGGFISTTLVTSPETFNRDLSEFRASDNSLRFNPGSTYAEFRDGDKMAGYGLAALIVGGAGAAVVKSGAGKGLIAALTLGAKAFFKVIIAGFVIAFAAIAKGFRKLFGIKKDEPEEQYYEAPANEPEAPAPEAIPAAPPAE